jgi:CheY-like chemotaxis protein
LVRYSVLLVEDNDEMRTLYGFILANAGFQVKAVRNGFDALTELQWRRPDVIVTDLSMPVVDGITLIEIIKSKAELDGIPVIAMTSYGRTLQRLATAAGADLAVAKPSESKTICDLVTSVLPQRQGNELIDDSGVVENLTSNGATPTT